MKHLTRFLLLIISILLFNQSVYAGSINSINIDVKLDKSGNAVFKETWDMDVSKGTEIYKPIYNLNDKTVDNFWATVDGKKLDVLSEWDVDKSREEKKGTCGINYVSQGIELCWGFGEYGNHTFEINYTVNNFITQYKGADATLWQYVGPGSNDPIKKVSIDIHSYEPVEDDFPIWSYGSKGYYYAKDGYIHFETDGELDYEEYVVLLLKFKPEYFLTSSVSDKTFDEVLEEANKGTYEYDYGEDEEDEDGIWGVIGTIIEFLVFAFVMGIVGTKAGSNSDRKGKYYFGLKGTSITKEEALYYRDIPFKNVIDGFYISSIYNINKNETDLIGALILKWIKEKQIRIINEATEKNVKKYAFELNKEYTGDNEHEKTLYTMFIKASKDNVLRTSDITKWIKRHYIDFDNWYKKIYKDEINKFLNNGKLNIYKKATLFSTNTYGVTDELRSDAVKLVGLKNFIEDFTTLKERKSLEVFTYEDYLIYAQIFGIAKEAAASFKSVYPELETTDNPYFNLYMYDYITSFTHDTAHAISKARQNATNYHGGGGGFSVGGGGGGFSGGGFGGGSR